MSIFGGPSRGGGGAPVVDNFGNRITERGQRPDTAYERAYGASHQSYVQAPVMQPGGNQLLFPSITTAPLVQTQTVNMNGQPSTKSIIVPSTQSLIPPPSTLLSSHYASLPNFGPAIVPGSSYSGMPTGISQTPIHRSQYLRGSGTLIGQGEGEDGGFDKVKKAKYRNDLLNQMNDNAGKRLEQRRMKQWQDEYDDDKVMHDNWDNRHRYDHEEMKRKQYLIKDGHIPGPGRYNRSHSRYSDYTPYQSTRYDSRYQVSRKGNRRDGNEDYGWWYGAPQTTRQNRPYRREHWWDRAPHPPPLPWMENQVHVNTGANKQNPDDAVTFYKGEMKGWWDKFVPAEVASKIQALVTDQLTGMQKKLNNQELAIQKEITQLR